MVLDLFFAKKLAALKIIDLEEQYGEQHNVVEKIFYTC